MSGTTKIGTASAATLGCLMMLGASSPAHAFGYDDYLGSISLVGFNFCPRGSLEARGQLLNIPGNEALFSLLGTMYGGDGRTTFALPDLRDKVPLPSNTGKYCVVIQGTFPSRR